MRGGGDWSPKDCGGAKAYGTQLEEFMKEGHVTHAHDDDVRLTTLAHCSG